MGKVSKTNQDKLKKLMSHPVFLTHDSNAKIIRAQLFFIASAAIFLTNTNIEIGKQSSILGIKLDGLTTDHVFQIALILIAYQLIHFCWASWESLCEWRIRQTALETAGWGGSGLSIKAENQNEKVRQTTLYAYLVDIIDLDIRKVRSIMEDEQGITQESINGLTNSLNNIQESINSERVRVSIVRFDKWYKMFYKAQNIRWLLLEFMLPVLLGLTATVFLTRRLGFIS